MPVRVQLIWKSAKLQVVGSDNVPTLPFLLEARQPNPALNCEQPSLIRVGSRYGYLRRDGRLLTDPPAFDYAQDFFMEHAAVQQGGKWGIIDTSARYVVEPKFDNLRPAQGTVFMDGQSRTLGDNSDLHFDPIYKLFPL